MDTFVYFHLGSRHFDEDQKNALQQAIVIERKVIIISLFANARDHSNMTII